MHRERSPPDPFGQGGRQFNGRASIHRVNGCSNKVPTNFVIARDIDECRCGGPTSDPSLFKLKTSVTVDFSTPTGGFQHDMMAAPTSSIVMRGSAFAAVPRTSRAATSPGTRPRAGFAESSANMKWPFQVSDRLLGDKL